MSAKKISEIEKGLAEAELNDDDDDEDGVDLSGFSPALITRLIALKQLQQETDLIDEQYKVERLALEQKFFNERKPMLEKRAQIVSGEIEVEIKPEDRQEGDEELLEDPDAPKGIPGFWLQAMQNHPSIGSYITQEDYTALEALRNITLDYNELWSGFRLSFHFNENEFFTNKVLTKSYTVSPDLLDDKAPGLTDVLGTEIDWKPKMNLCVSETKKKQKSKSKAKAVRVVTKLTPKPSFFHFFSKPSMEEEEEEDEDEEGADGDFKLSVDEDYECGHAFRAEIVPEAVAWYTGEAIEDEEEDDMELEEDEEEEEDDEEGPAGESDAVGGIEGTGGFSAGGAQGTQQPECKQS